LFSFFSLFFSQFLSEFGHFFSIFPIYPTDFFRFSVRVRSFFADSGSVGFANAARARAAAAVAVAVAVASKMLGSASIFGGEFERLEAKI
jgi:cytosine/uracil/thiamine/allantoin permease